MENYFRQRNDNEPKPFANIKPKEDTFNTQPTNTDYFSNTNIQKPKQIIGSLSQDPTYNQPFISNNNVDPDNLANNLANLINKAILKASEKIQQPNQRQPNHQTTNITHQESQPPYEDEDHSVPNNSNNNFSNTNFRRALDTNNQAYNNFNNQLRPGVQRGSIENSSVVSNVSNRGRY